MPESVPKVEEGLGDGLNRVNTLKYPSGWCAPTGGDASSRSSETKETARPAPTGGGSIESPPAPMHNAFEVGTLQKDKSTAAASMTLNEGIDASYHALRDDSNSESERGAHLGKRTRRLPVSTRRGGPGRRARRPCHWPWPGVGRWRDAPGGRPPAQCRPPSLGARRSRRRRRRRPPDSSPESAPDQAVPAGARRAGRHSAPLLAKFAAGAEF
jgi:hypothetical protein